MAEVVKRVIDYEMFGILLLDEAAGELVLRKAVSYGPTKEKTRIALGEGLTGAAALTQAADPGRRRARGPALPAA